MALVHLPLERDGKRPNRLELSPKQNVILIYVSFLSQQHEYFSFTRKQLFYKLLCIFNTFKNTVCEPQSGKHKLLAGNLPHAIANHHRSERLRGVALDPSTPSVVIT